MDDPIIPGRVRTALKARQPCMGYMCGDPTLRLCPTHDAAPILLAAARKAFEASCRRSETRKKWTNEDQAVHEQLKDAIEKAGV